MNARALLPIFALTLLPLLVRADRPPDFETDARPIIAQQPGLLDYIHKHFEIKETGLAARGNGDQPPQPPFIFNARPKGQSGPFYLRLLIQPGAPGQIMKVADIRKLSPGTQPPPAGIEQAVGSTPPSPTAPSEAPAESTPAEATPAPSQAPTASSSSEPSAATPSGPIRN